MFSLTCHKTFDGLEAEELGYPVRSLCEPELLKADGQVERNGPVPGLNFGHLLEKRC